MLSAMAKRMPELGVRPELEVFDTRARVDQRGIDRDRPLIQLCMGIRYGTPDTLMATVGKFALRTVYSAFSIGPDAVSVCGVGAFVRANERVGWRTTCPLPRAAKTTNAELVQRAVEILERICVRVISPDEVRECSRSKFMSERSNFMSKGSMSEMSKLMSDSRPRAVGLLGGGVIGGAWAARFVLNGVDVRLHGRSPATVERVQKILANARRAYRRLTQVPLPAEGALTVVRSVADAVRGVELVQESAPDSLELKQQLLAAASRAATPGTLICSSTSGLRPSLLQAGMDHPERLLVAHPFNPVYLLPLVELCAGRRTAPETLARAAEIYRSVGMHPLVVRKEEDGFIANRLQEAVWREALWLLHDDLATVQEIDDAVRYSFGLRRAVMGPIQTYRIAISETSARRSMERFGPALKLPWTKLTDVPELTDVFLDKLADQLDAQAENLTIPELEQKRDDCLVAVLQGLRSQHHGAGETLARWEQGLRDRDPPPTSGSGPLRMPRQIPSDCIDYNGHVNESRHLQLFRSATDTLLRYIGLDGEYRSNSGNYRTVETHLSHLRELYAGERVQVLTQVLGADDKRLQLFHVLTREGDDGPAATGEQMLVHVDAGSGRSGPVQGNVRQRLLELARLHAELPRPERAGASIRLR